MTNKEAALNFVNKIRIKFGLQPVCELKKGKRESSSSCTLAKTLSFGNRNIKVSFGNKDLDILFNGAYFYFPIPKRISSFIVAFDRGKYPELIK